MYTNMEAPASYFPLLPTSTSLQSLSNVANGPVGSSSPMKLYNYDCYPYLFHQAPPSQFQQYQQTPLSQHILSNENSNSGDYARSENNDSSDNDDADSQCSSSQHQNPTRFQQQRGGIKRSSSYMLQQPPPDTESVEEAKVNALRSKRRTRTKFTKQQLDILEATFGKTHYPDVTVVDRLSNVLELGTERISIWFQNRRARYKKTKKPEPVANSRYHLERVGMLAGEDDDDEENSNKENETIEENERCSSRASVCSSAASVARLPFTMNAHQNTMQSYYQPIAPMPPHMQQSQFFHTMQQQQQQQQQENNISKIINEVAEQARQYEEDERCRSLESASVSSTSARLPLMQNHDAQMIPQQFQSMQQQEDKSDVAEKVKYENDDDEEEEEEEEEKEDQEQQSPQQQQQQSEVKHTESAPTPTSEYEAQQQQQNTATETSNQYEVHFTPNKNEDGDDSNSGDLSNTLSNKEDDSSSGNSSRNQSLPKDAIITQKLEIVTSFPSSNESSNTNYLLTPNSLSSCSRSSSTSNNAFMPSYSYNQNSLLSLAPSATQQSTMSTPYQIPPAFQYTQQHSNYYAPPPPVGNIYGAQFYHQAYAQQQHQSTTADMVSSSFQPMNLFQPYDYNSQQNMYYAAAAAYMSSCYQQQDFNIQQPQQETTTEATTQ